MLSDWNYRSLCIDLGNMGYRREEPVGVLRETSTVLAKVLSALWTKRLTKSNIADDLGVPLEEVEALIFGLAGVAPTRPETGRPSLVPNERQSDPK